jgi:hypothetical protein
MLSNGQMSFEEMARYRSLSRSWGYGGVTAARG